MRAGVGIADRHRGGAIGVAPATGDARIGFADLAERTARIVDAFDARARLAIAYGAGTVAVAGAAADALMVLARGVLRTARVGDAGITNSVLALGRRARAVIERAIAIAEAALEALPGEAHAAERALAVVEARETRAGLEIAVTVRTIAIGPARSPALAGDTREPRQRAVAVFDTRHTRFGGAERVVGRAVAPIVTAGFARAAATHGSELAVAIPFAHRVIRGLAGYEHEHEDDGQDQSRHDDQFGGRAELIPAK